MGRAFEYRKERKMKRWASMAKNFTKIGREIALAVKACGGYPNYNSRLRLAVQNAKTVNMPKANVDSAIKNALSKDATNYQEVVYEGYGAGKIAIIVETATDNPTRTIANMRLYFSRNGGEVTSSGTHDFIFSRKGVFRIKAEGINIEDLELELIDIGLEELKTEEDEILIYAAFEDFGTMQKGLEEKGFEVLSAELQRLPTMTKKITEEQAEQIIKLIDKLEEDDDVQNVFHNMDMTEE
jgi:YebC/PmpR family DNA-binding regulatory protein